MAACPACGARVHRRKGVLPPACPKCGAAMEAAPPAGAAPAPLPARSPHGEPVATEADTEGVLAEPSHPTPELRDLAEVVAVAPLSDDQPQLMAESGWLEAPATGNGSAARAAPREAAPVAPRPSRARPQPPASHPEEEGILAEPAASAPPPPAPQEKATVRKRPRRPARRSEERRVGKECRSRWSPYH